MLERFAVVLLWLLAGGGAIWVVGPAIAYAFGRRRLGFQVNEDPSRAGPQGKDPAYERAFTQLSVLGFRPAGISFETAWFFSPLHWWWRSHGTRWLASPDQTTFVGFHRLAGMEPLRSYAATAFDGGGIYLSSSPGAGVHVDPGGNYGRAEVGKLEPGELLERHHQDVETFRRDRNLTIKRATLREIVAEDVELTRRVIPSMTGMYGLLLAFGPVAYGALQLPGSHLPPWLRPAVICFGAIIFAAMRWAVLPSRVPRVIRFVPMAAILLLPTFATLLVKGGGSRLSKAIGRVEAAAEQGVRSEPDEMQILDHGPTACRPLLIHLSKPAASPSAKQALHRLLVQLKGSDLGQQPEPWRRWCSEMEGTESSPDPANSISGSTTARLPVQD